LKYGSVIVSSWWAGVLETPSLRNGTRSSSYPTQANGRLPSGRSPVVVHLNASRDTMSISDATRLTPPYLLGFFT